MWNICQKTFLKCVWLFLKAFGHKNLKLRKFSYLISCLPHGHQLSSFDNRQAEEQFKLKHWKNHTYCVEKEFQFFSQKNLKMEEANKTNISLILNMLPPEMLEKILNFLNYKEICQAKLISRRWKEIIDKGNLLKKVRGKTFFKFTYFYVF